MSLSDALSALVSLQSTIDATKSTLEEAVNKLSVGSAVPSPFGLESISKGLAATMDNYVTEWMKLHPNENIDDYCIVHKQCRDGSVAHWIEKKGSRE